MFVTALNENNCHPQARDGNYVVEGKVNTALRDTEVDRRLLFDRSEPEHAFCQVFYCSVIDLLVSVDLVSVHSEGDLK